MKEIKESFADGYVVETLSGKRMMVVSSNAKIKVNKNDSSIIINDELVKLLDKITKNK
jgi:hypothetical protein